MIVVRTATPQDAEALVAIYQPYVLETAITFEYHVPTIAEFSRRISQTLARYPFLVAERAGEIVGYAYAGAYKGRSAYDWSCEVTVYVKQGIQVKGIGSRLYQGLECCLAKQQVVNLTACITEGNQGSVAFHEKFGYQQVARFPKIGYKFGKWHDVLWLQKALQIPTNPPKAFRPYPDSYHESVKM